ncbi:MULTISPECIES: SGNH/GDSL hydrolase family protein [Photorhabdus]|uniref:Lysophospholipase L1-like esterase n=2 Tax=Photorhabdus asymbiotica TaxID=291112 RepID=A0ABX9SP75_9GAMM|nr:SGNH/GDSL hydrolase family protein [Photorhabdus asymbiotica]RKS59807.1 lysophospholipase L1-like esterase [Photorhabdus asymbiotica]
MEMLKKLHKRYQSAGIGLVIILSLSLISCNKQRPEHLLTQYPVKMSQQLTDFGEPNLALLADKLRNSRHNQLHFIQIGDSHTAADFFTGKLRSLLQQRFGDAGIGFVSPISIPGQRSAMIGMTSHKQQWELTTSRKDNRPDFPLGGAIAEPNSETSKLVLKLFVPSYAPYQLKALYQTSTDSQILVQSATKQVLKLPATRGQWQFSSEKTVKFPVNIMATQDNQLKLGGWFIKRKQPGVILSALGINGATINMMDKWQPQWINTLVQMHPDLIIFAYGTNAAFNDSLDLSDYRQQLTTKIKQIRYQLPKTVILIIGPNDSLKNSQATSCTTQQPTMLNDVIRIQQKVAQDQHTLFWNWREYMGGECSIKSWAQQNLARPDYVHLSAAGYELSAKALYKQLIDILGQ